MVHTCRLSFPVCIDRTLSSYVSDPSTIWQIDLSLLLGPVSVLHYDSLCFKTIVLLE